MTQALALREDSSLAMPAMSIEQAVQRYNAVVEFTQKIMKKGRDYGVIPGTEGKGQQGKEGGLPRNDNSTLLKPGAEKLCTLFGLTPDFEDYRVTEDWDKGLFYYAYRCVLYRGDRRIASAIGSANSREKKYRRVSRKCPECGAAAIKRSGFAPKDDPNGKPGWYCHAKSGGCGAGFKADDPEITEQRGEVDPSECGDLVNTLQKMAQKRSLVAAALIATNASEFFTQDAEEIDAEWAPRREPDLSQDNDFYAAWFGVAETFDLNQATARGLLFGVLRKRKLSLTNADAAVRHKLLEDFQAMTPEAVTKLKAAASQPTSPAPPPAGPQPPPATTPDPEPTAELPPVTPDDVSDSTRFLELCLDTLPDEDIIAVVESVQRHAKLRHRGEKVPADAENALTVQERIEVVTAMREGRYDLQASTIAAE